MAGGIDERSLADGTIRYRARKRIPGQPKPVVRTFDTRDEAERWLLDITQAVRRGRYDGGSSLTVAECVEQYIDRSQSRWRGNTTDIHARNLRLRIQDHRLGRVPLSDLTPRMVQAWIDGMDGKPATVKLAGQTLSGALSEAVRLGIIPSNPSTNVTYPSRRAYLVNPWTRAEVHRIYAHVADNVEMHAFYRLALVTGIRSGELRALHWSDLHGRVLHIHRTVHGWGSNVVIREGTKTGEGRKVTVPASVTDALDAWREMREGELMFPSPTHGGILDAGTLSRRHKGESRDAGVRIIRVHDLRHTAATMMLAAGVPVKVVSERLGHQTTQITMDIYQWVDFDMQEAAVDKLEAWLNG